ncbi:HAD-like domain-containing protein [Paraphoma chrysanthemicola]|nr:HAD-like domain-containing protein [Paraphoma chrysanthemicola]
MSAVVPARYIPHGTPVATSDTNLDKTAVGRRDSISPEKTISRPSAADMNDYLNPQAVPFRPGGARNEAPPMPMDRRRNEHYPPPQPMMPPFGFRGAPWHPNFPPPPPPPPFFAHNQAPYNEYEAHQQAQAHEQARAYHNHWAHNNAPPGPHAPFPPYGPPPMHPQQHYPPQFPHPHHQQQRQPGFPHPAHFAAMQQANWPQGATNDELQYAFNALIRGLKSKNRSANTSDRAPTQPPKKSKKSKAKAKAAANGEDSQQEYGSLHRVDSFGLCNSRIDKAYSTPPPPKIGKKGKYGDHKIMLPAPQPTDLYLDQAAGEPSAADTPGDLLVILDLNGTVLFRPNKNAKTMIARPYLKPFLRYLFQNFKVMVWSSAKPANVKSLVEQSLDKDLRSILVATWARDTFGLSATNFNQNVQVYKNLRLIWSRDQIQQHHPKYEAGERFGQHNTVLIDDSALKASAQPHNLLEIPEFEATPEQMEGDDVLREVAGYLEMLRQQADVSKFINKQPFKSDGRWNFDWPNEAAGGGDMTDKVTLKGKRPTPAARVSDMTNTLSSVSLGGVVPKKA